MKNYFFALVVAVALAGSCPLQAQRLFASPEDATKALREAAESGDKTTVHDIFGPEIHQFLTGDEKQDKRNFHEFSQAIAEACVPEPEGSDRVILSIGTNQWPFPIPLVKTNGQWMFDTVAGREEIITRHIGADELYAIGICHRYADAQKAYFDEHHEYARDWMTLKHTNIIHGYVFKVLTRGASKYISHGKMTGGYALVAYPAVWGKSGIMTFLVSEDGKVYQQNLDEDTASIAGRMKRYAPDANWTVVAENGAAEP
ncbi:MAG TPA: DUF2950 family protein [Verrucomicrobiae bacterium]|jgi:hypothetical protein|nr:DUF2950 family protein [Verrucomicrobiae bacterium]